MDQQVIDIDDAIAEANDLYAAVESGEDVADPIERLRKIINGLLYSYDSSETSVIWEYGGDTDAHDEEVENLRLRINKILDYIDGRLTVDDVTARPISFFRGWGADK